MSETISVHNMFSPGLSLEMNNFSSCCGLVDAKIRASDKDLPVCRGENDTLYQKIPLISLLPFIIENLRKLQTSDLNSSRKKL